MKAILQTVRFCNDDVIATSEISYCDLFGVAHFIPRTVNETIVDGQVRYTGELYTYFYDDNGLICIDEDSLVPFDITTKVEVGKYYHNDLAYGKYIICENQNHLHAGQ